MTSRTRKFFSFYGPYRRLLIADVASAAAASMITLILPIAVRSITRIVAAGMADGLAQIYRIGAGMLALAALHTLCTIFVDYRGHMMGAFMERDMRRELFDHYQKLSFRFYDAHKTGALMARITHDLLGLAEFYHHGPEDLVIGVLTVLGVLVVSAVIDPALSGLIGLFIPVMLVYAVHFNRKMNRAITTSRERIGEINAQVEDSLAGIRVVQSFTNERLEAAKFASRNELFVDSRRADYKSSSYFGAGMIASTNVMTIAVVLLGAAAIARGRLGVSDLLTALLYVGILIDPVQRLVNFARVYQEGITGFRRFMDILDVEPDIADEEGAIEVERVEGRVRFEEVRFSYGDDRAVVLDHINLTIEAREYVAIVGPSGIGKTTLCSLIPRFYEVTDGAVLLDGVNVRDIRLASLRRHIGVVEQDVYVLAGSVADNIRYGRPGATVEEVVAAAKMANAHEFIDKLPDGYETEVGQRGVTLSGGQKQRLGIARVFLKDPPIIIFDEATSALDNESEGAVRQSMERLATSRTTIVIAHRLSTVRRASRIIVLTEKGIEEQGSHGELMARKGVYARLYDTSARI